MESGENCVNLIPLGKVAWLIMNRRIILFDLSISKVLCKTNILKAPQLKNWSAYFFCIAMSSFENNKRPSSYNFGELQDDLLLI